MKSRLTDFKKEVLSVIDKAEKPLIAKAILNRMNSEPNLSTIYRALDFLRRKKYIQSVSFSGVKFYFTGKKGNGHFLVCKECHEIIEFEDCIALNLQKKIQEQYDYKITDHVLYFKGLCPECQKYLKRKEKLLM